MVGSVLPVAGERLTRTGGLLWSVGLVSGTGGLYWNLNVVVHFVPFHGWFGSSMLVECKDSMNSAGPVIALVQMAIAGLAIVLCIEKSTRL